MKNFDVLFVINSDFTIIALANSKLTMGRGDKKTKKGKIFKDSYGNSRNKKAIKAKLKRNASKKTVEAGAVTAKPKRAAAKTKEA